MSVKETESALHVNIRAVVFKFFSVYNGYHMFPNLDSSKIPEQPETRNIAG